MGEGVRTVSYDTASEERAERIALHLPETLQALWHWHELQLLQCILVEYGDDIGTWLTARAVFAWHEL